MPVATDMVNATINFTRLGARALISKTAKVRFCVCVCVCDSMLVCVLWVTVNATINFTRLGARALISTTAKVSWFMMLLY